MVHCVLKYSILVHFSPCDMDHVSKPNTAHFPANSKMHEGVIIVLSGALGFFYFIVPVCRQRVQTTHTKSKVRHITGKTLIGKSCSKIQENQLAVDFMINALC